MGRGTSQVDGILYGTTPIRFFKHTPQTDLEALAGRLELDVYPRYMIEAVHTAVDADARAGDRTVSQRVIMLRDKTNLPRPAVESVLDDLVQDGLIERVSSDHVEYNSRRWKLTELGCVYCRLNFIDA